MLYGKPTKHIRHVDENTITLEPQRFFVHKFWCHSHGATTRVDGQDLINSKDVPSGSRITSHKMEILITPETIEPQQIYMGRLKLSFNDVLSEPICGMTYNQASYQTTPTEVVLTNPITPHLHPKSTNQKVDGDETANQEIGGASSGFGIVEWKMDDNIHHYINLKKITVFDQRPLMGDRKQRVPSKVKRSNPYMFYGLFLFNDSVRGGTPADTQVKINIKSEWNEMAI